MILDIITGVTGFASTLLDKFWPDADAADKRKHEQFINALGNELRLQLAQIEVNKEEAKHASIWVAGWRPGIGWLCVAALGYQFLLYPFLTWIWVLLQVKGIVPFDLDVPPLIDTGPLFALVTGMLGIGVMRSVDKAKGVDTKEILKRMSVKSK
jgi:hypothetical protein